MKTVLHGGVIIGGLTDWVTDYERSTYGSSTC